MIIRQIDVQVNSPESGTIQEYFAKEGDTVSVGGNLFKILLGDAPSASQVASEKKAAAPEPVKAAPPPPAPVAAPAPVSAPTPAPKPAPKKETPKAAASASAPVTVDGPRSEKRVRFYL